MLANTEQAVRNASSDSKIVSAMIDARVDFFLTYPDHLLFFHLVRGLMQLEVEIAKDLCEVYDAHLRRLTQLVKPALGAGWPGDPRDVATAIAAFTSGLLTYHLLFEGQESIRNRRDYFTRVLEWSLQGLLKSESTLR